MFMNYHQVTSIAPASPPVQERSGRARGAHSDFPQWDAGGEQAAGFAQPVRIHLAWILGLDWDWDTSEAWRCLKLHATLW